MSLLLKKISSLEKSLGHCFNDVSLLIQALTHRSASKYNNERLEFLGDSILQQVISEKLYNLYPTKNEGELSNIRSFLVCKNKLSKIAKKLKIDSYIYFGKGEIRKNGGKNNSILTGFLESIIAAVYFDSDMKTCRDFILNLYKTDFSIQFLEVKKNPKSFLQELLQGYAKPIPEYINIPVFIEKKTRAFVVISYTSSTPYIGRSIAKNIRLAQQISAKRILEIINVKN